MTTASRIALGLALAATAIAAFAAVAAVAGNSRVPGPAAGRSRTAAVATPPRPVGATGIVLPAADPMAAEMQRELERSQREYAALFQRLSLSRSESEALEIEEDMGQQRVGLQIALLRIQAGYARRAGRNGFADQLERAIAALISADPPRPSAPDGQRRL